MWIERWYELPLMFALALALLWIVTKQTRK